MEKSSEKVTKTVEEEMEKLKIRWKMKDTLATLVTGEDPETYLTAELVEDLPYWLCDVFVKLH